MKFTKNIQSLLLSKASLGQHHRSLVLGGHLFFFLMLLLSIFYYQERMLSLDTANYVFQLILSNDFYTGQGRTLTYITQILPLLALKWGLSLKAILIIYSASFILFYYACFLVIVHLFHNPKAGIFLALSLCLSLRYKFYGPVGEVVLSMALLAILIAWITRPENRFTKIPAWMDVGIGLGLATLLLSGHPFIVVSAALFFGFDLLNRWRWKDWKFWVVSLYTGLIFILKMTLGPSNEYTEMRLGRLSDIKEVIKNLPDLYITDRLLWFFETEYAFPFIIFLLSLVWLWPRKQKLLSLYLLSAFGALLGLILLMHNYLNAPIYIMLDGYLSHLGLLWALPLAFCWLPERSWWMTILVGILLLFGLDRIRNKHHFFRDRIDYLQELLDQHTEGDQRKFLAHMDQFDWEKLWMPWAISFETLMISSLEGPGQSTTLYYQQHHENWEEKIRNPEFLLSLHYAPEFIQHDWLPTRYFSLPRVPYRKIVVEQ